MRIGSLDFADSAVAEVFEMPSAAMERAATIILVGCNIRHELPLVHQRLLKASKHGAKIFSINQVDFEFAFGLAGLQLVRPSELAGALAAVAQAAGASLPAGLTAASRADASAIVDALRAAAGEAVIVLGEIAEQHASASHIRAAARALAKATGAKVNRIPQGANAVGLAQSGVVPGSAGKNAVEMLAQPAQTFLLFGIEPQYDFIDATAATRALGESRVVAFAAFASEHLKAVADVILPIGLLPEIEASFSNLDGIVQTSVPGGKLPGEARSGWRVLRALIETMALPGFDFTDIAGLRARAREGAALSGTGLSPVQAGSTGLERIVSSPIYRTDAVLRRAPALNAHPLTVGPRVSMHPQDAASRGLTEGMMARVGDGNGVAALPVVISVRVAPGSVWIERAYEATAPLSPSVALEVIGA